jgi:hypothetical protein
MSLRFFSAGIMAKPANGRKKKDRVRLCGLKSVLAFRQGAIYLQPRHNKLTGTTFEFGLSCANAKALVSDQ